jgi:hypothetical protein
MRSASPRDRASVGEVICKRLQVYKAILGV